MLKLKHTLDRIGRDTSSEGDGRGFGASSWSNMMMPFVLRAAGTKPCHIAVITTSDLFHHSVVFSPFYTWSRRDQLFLNSTGITNIETVWDLSAGMGQTLKWVCNFIFHQGGRGGKSHVLSCNARRLDGPLIVRTLIPVRHTYTRTLCWMIGYRGWFRLLLCRTSENA